VRAYPLYLLIRGVNAFAGTTAFTLSQVFQMQNAGLGPLQLLLAGTAMEVVCLVAQVPTGVLADVYSRRLPVVTGYLVMGAGALVWVVAPTFAGILAGTMLWGVGCTCVDGAEEAWIADEVGDARAGAVFTRATQVGQLSAIAGIVASVALGTVHLGLPIAVGGTAWLVLGGYLAVRMPEHRPPRSTMDTRPSLIGQAFDGVRAVRRNPLLLLLLGAVFFTALGGEGFDRLGQPHFLADLTFPPLWTPVVWFGVLGVAGTLGAIGLTQLVRRWVDALDPVRLGRLLAVFTATRFAALLTFALAGEFWLAAGAYLAVGLLASAAGPLSTTFLVGQTAPSTRATVLSIMAQVDAAGEIAGGPPVGVVGERGSIRAALVLTAAFLAPAVACVAGAARRASRPRASIKGLTTVDQGIPAAEPGVSRTRIP